MYNLCVLFVFFITVAAHASTADVVDMDDAVRAVQALQQSMPSQTDLSGADGTARQITNRLLHTNPTKHATAAETEAMVNAHLYAELFYAFNTGGGNSIRDHRLIYDFIIHLTSPDYAQPAQKQHLTILTILSLAAQEYFWNPLSNVEDLQKHVHRELRYGLYKTTGNSLYVADRVYLGDAPLDGLISNWVTGDLLRRLTDLRAQIGAPSSALMRALHTPLNAMQTGKVARKINLHGLQRAGEFGVPDAALDLLRFSSCGDGLCGLHSLFIPNDGARDGVDNNSRAKMLQLLADNIDDPDLEKFYFFYSPFSDAGSVEKTYTVGGTFPEALREKYAEFERMRNEKNAAAGADGLTPEQRETLNTANVQELSQWLFKNMWPVYKTLAPTWRESVSKHVHNLALKDSGLGGSGWIYSEANVLRLWALTHNENVFVWSDAMVYNNAPFYSPINYFDITNAASIQYTQSHYDAASALVADPTEVTADKRRLSDVVWASPRAKRIYLTKSANHYDKYIEQNDWGALARQKRHEQWMGLGAEKYAIYPAAKGGGAATAKK